LQILCQTISPACLRACRKQNRQAKRG
jgi:hypothetical protein